MVFGLKDDVNFSNSDTVKHFVESYYVIKKEKNRISDGFVDFDITKQELDEHLKKYFNIERVNYTNILKETCPDYDEYTKTFNWVELSVFLKYDAIKEKYESLENEECFNNPSVDFDYNPEYTKIYSIEKNQDEYILTLTGIWYVSGEPSYDRDNKVPVPLECTPNNCNVVQELEDYEKNYENNKEKYVKYQITFKKNNDNTLYNKFYT